MNHNRERTRQAILTMGIGAGVNALLSIVKLFIGLSTNSISIMSDAVNNLGDIVACLIAIFSFAALRKRKSDSLSFGYGRMEYIADFLMSVIVLLVGVYFAYSALERLLLPYLMTFHWGYFFIILAAAVVKIGLGAFYLRRNKRVQSNVLRAAAIDSFCDAGITVMTLIGFSLAKYAKLRIDAIFGLVISGLIIFNGAKLLWSSVKTLLGEKLDKGTDALIRTICLASPYVREVVKTTLHNYGADTKEIIVDAVFTNGIEFDIIYSNVSDLRNELVQRTGASIKICIAREEDEFESEKSL